MSTTNNQPRLFYRIVVDGVVKPGWQEWFLGSDVNIDPVGGGSLTTILNATVTDQSALRGLLNQIWDLNLSILSLNQV